MPLHFIHIAGFSTDQLRAMIARAIADKARFKAGLLEPVLQGRTLAMIFEKPSLRTRVSFETAMTQLGGHGIYLTDADIGLGKREPVQDAARVLSLMCDGIVARTFSHQVIVDLAKYSSVPVINALSDYSHPCQAMADLMTVMEHFKTLPGRTLAFIGDGNNVARSLAVACGLLGMKFVLACPPGHSLQTADIAPLGDAARVTHDAAEAVSHADIVYTDTWVSMGQEAEKEKRHKAFKDFQINAALMAKAPRHAIVMHCLPAYRGYEITDEVFEAHAATIFEEAANRLHFQRSLLAMLVAEGKI